VPAARAFADARRAGSLRSGSSATPVDSRDRQGSPRLLGHLRPTRHCHTPRRKRQPLALLRCRRLLPSELAISWASWYDVFGADLLVAHRLACLRIHRRVAAVVARLATDLPGSALVERELHPPDDKQDFANVLQRSLLPDQHCLVAPLIPACSPCAATPRRPPHGTAHPRYAAPVSACIAPSAFTPRRCGSQRPYWFLYQHACSPRTTLPIPLAPPHPLKIRLKTHPSAIVFLALRGVTPMGGNEQCSRFLKSSPQQRCSSAALGPGEP
jgi:hypothetical protein